MVYYSQEKLSKLWHGNSCFAFPKSLWGLHFRYFVLVQYIVVQKLVKTFPRVIAQTYWNKTLNVLIYNLSIKEEKYQLDLSKLQGRRHRGTGGAMPPPPPTIPLTSLNSKKKKGRQGQKRKGFKAETIERLSPRAKYYCFSHSRASRIRKFSLSANHGGQKYFSVFQGSNTFQCFNVQNALEYS